MYKLVLPIYKYFVLKRFKPTRAVRTHIYKLATHAMLGLGIMLSLAPAIRAQALPTQTTQAATPAATVHHSYIDTTGWLDGSTNGIELGQLQWVTTTHRLSRGYSGGHTGLDIDGEFGDPIYSMTDGVVESVSSGGPYGNKIIISHPGGLKSLYAHLQTMDVEPGQTVTAGEYIGTMGSTGRSTGSHLHLEVFRNGALIDPATVL